jgi:hypothetical protein
VSSPLRTQSPRLSEADRGVPVGTLSTSTKTPESRRPESVDQQHVPAPGLADPLIEIDSALAALNERDKQSTESASRLLEARQDFLDEFHAVCETLVRPAMESVLDRLRQDGGDGVIEEHPGGEARVSTPRLTLWMSLQGEISGVPRLDRHPYLQLDADIENRVIRLTEGDSWHSKGTGHSGSAGTWIPADVTRALVIEELLAIVLRSARISAT